MAAAPRGVGRWRLAIWDAGQRIVYDEIRDYHPWIFTARRADGGDTLFIATNELHALRPVVAPSS